MKVLGVLDRRGLTPCYDPDVPDPDYPHSQKGLRGSLIADGLRHAMILLVLIVVCVIRNTLDVYCVRCIVKDLVID
jgi:hypothetical protein